MSLNIDKEEMDQSWINRKNNDKFYHYLYSIAKHQVIRKGIRYSDREDYIQFALFKCFSHQDAYNLNRGRAYSFFWKQISLAIAYKLRKIKRRNDKVSTVFVDQEKIVDWADNLQQQREGVSFSDIVDTEELQFLKEAFKNYNSNHKGKKLKPTKSNTIRVFKWIERKSPDFLNNFTTLKIIFKSWLKASI